MWLSERKIERIPTNEQGEDNSSRNDSTNEKRKETKTIITFKDEKDEDGTKAIRNNSLSAPVISGISITNPLKDKEVEWKMKMNKNENQRKKSTVIMTSGGLIFTLLAATLVTATFVMSPIIEKIFSKYNLIEP